MSLESIKKKFEDAKISATWTKNKFKIQSRPKATKTSVKGLVTKDGRLMILRCGGIQGKKLKPTFDKIANETQKEITIS